MKLLFDISVYPLSSIYLIDTTTRDGDKTVYKFGRTRNMKYCLRQYKPIFWDDIIVDLIMFMPEDKLSEAETSLKNLITRNYLS